MIKLPRTAEEITVCELSGINPFSLPKHSSRLVIWVIWLCKNSPEAIEISENITSCSGTMYRITIGSIADLYVLKSKSEQITCVRNKILADEVDKIMRERHD